MGKKWKDDRIPCEVKCILNVDQTIFQGVIENLSLSGALVKLNNKMSFKIHPDDMCDLVFGGNPELYPMKYICKVIRVDSEMIGVQFLELNIM